MKPIHKLSLVAVAAVTLAGCEFLSTTTNSVTSAVKSVTDVTSSTTGGKEKSSSFVDTRFAAIQAEAARGEGEHLDSLATLLGEPDRAEFSRWMHGNYNRLFSDLKNPQELLARIEKYRGPAG
jgi:hypothetical protein